MFNKFNAIFIPLSPSNVTWEVSTGERRDTRLEKTTHPQKSLPFRHNKTLQADTEFTRLWDHIGIANKAKNLGRLKKTIVLCEPKGRKTTNVLKTKYKLQQYENSYLLNHNNTSCPFGDY